MSKAIKVQEVYIKRFKKVEDFTHTFNGDSVIISGPNEMGKTSILTFIRALLGDASVIPPGALPEGEIKITKGDKEYTIRGVVEKGKSRLIVCVDGLEDKRPETLHELVGAVSFDPFAFVAKSTTKALRKEQVEDIKKLLPEEVRNDLLKYEADIAARFDERTNLNRDLKNAKGAIESHPLYHLAEKQLRELKPVNVESVFAELKAANDINAKVATGKQRREDLINQIAEDEKALAELQAKIAASKEKLKVADKWLSENQPIDTSAMSATIEQSQKINEDYNRAQELIRLYERKIALEENVGELTVQIEQNREMISEAVKEMSHIVEGMAYDDEGLTLNGIPVHPNSLSTSQIISLAYKIKMFENPDTPLFIDCVESLDSDKYEALINFAAENDLQIIGAEVSRSKEKKIEFHIIKTGE